MYRNVYETWRFEVNSYWQRNAYFAAFETAAIGGCWYLLEKHLIMGLLFSILGMGLSLLWLWNNVAVHKYIEYWWQCIKDTERALGLHENATDFANKHPGSGLKPSLGAKLVPVIFSLAWLALVGHAIYPLFHSSAVADPPLSAVNSFQKASWDNGSVLDWLKESVLRPDVFWVMATALGTIALVFVAQKQLTDLAQTSRSDFLYRLKKDFFTKQVSDFNFLLENDLLTFTPGPIPTFYTNTKHGVKPEKGAFTTNTIDDVLLGPLEDVGVLWKLGRLSLNEVYETFDYYVSLCVENKAIADYIKWVRKEPGDEDIYDHLLLLHRKLKEEGPKIRAKKRRSMGRLA